MKPQYIELETIMEVFFGVLIMKFGARTLIACGFGCLICPALFYAFANGLAMFYLAGFSWALVQPGPPPL